MALIKVFPEDMYEILTCIFQIPNGTAMLPHGAAAINVQAFAAAHHTHLFTSSSVT